MNWGQIKQAVSDYLKDTETSFVGYMSLFARLAESDIYRKVQLQLAKQLATATLLATDRYINVPTDSLAIYSFSYVDPDTDEHVFIYPKDLSFLREAFPNPASVGPPRFYAYRDEQVLAVGPTPDQNYAVEMWFFRMPDSISKDDDDDNDTWLSQKGESALIFGIILQGYIYLKGDQDVIASYQKQYDDAVSELKIIAEGRQAKDTYRQPDARTTV